MYTRKKSAPDSFSWNHISIEVVGNRLVRTTDDDSPETSTSDALSATSGYQSISTFAVTYQEEDQEEGTITLRAIVQGVASTYVGPFKILNDKFQSWEQGGFGNNSDVDLLGSVENSPYALWERGGNLYLWNGPSLEAWEPADELNEPLNAAIADGATIKVGTDSNLFTRRAHGGGFSPGPDDFILYYRRAIPTPGRDVVVRFYRSDAEWVLQEEAAEEQLTESLQVGQLGEDVYMLFNPASEVVNTEPLDSEDTSSSSSIEVSTEPLDSTDVYSEDTSPPPFNPATHVNTDIGINTDQTTWDSHSLYYRNLWTSKQSNLSLPPISVVQDRIESQPALPSTFSGEINLDNTMPMHFSLMNDNDDARIYLEEYYLHLPVLIATYLNEKGRYAEAMEWLSKVYDPFQPSEEDRRVYSDFSSSAIAEASLRAIGIWLRDPFNPYALADMHKESHLINVKLLHVKNFLDWADQLFTLDTSELVNRARELYELAGMILGLDEWPPGCHDFSSTVYSGTDATVGELLEIADTDAESPWDEDELLATILEGDLDELGLVTIGDEIPALMPFCLPVNPMVNLLRWRIESNRAKIRTNRNFAGMKRELQPYATPVDPRRLVQQAASGGLDFNQFIPSSPPPVYRYSFLVERAKYLVSVAQQFEGSMLSALEKADAETYGLMKAIQDIRLERSNVTLQGLRVREANDSVTLAERQRERAEFQQTHFDDLLSVGLLQAEEDALGFMVASAATQAVAAVLYAAADNSAGGAASSVASVFSTTSSILSTIASNKRRAQEWKYQRDLAEYDVDIADLGIDIAEDRVDIVEQEREIANLRLEHANDTVEFLGNKFTNEFLYQWMHKNLLKLYREQLNMAISTAKAAQLALEFERQTSLDFIGYDYWDSEKKGLLGAEQLLKDLAKMEQFRLSSATRKKEIEKTISLASFAPAEFQRFKETGVLEFGTIPRWFKRDFPGHYMRLIRNVNISVFALIPPNEGIHATLSNPGISYIMVGEPFEARSIVHRLPESIAISSPRAGTGLFELRPDDPMLFPFEGSGVDTTWRLEMDKGANRFDYDTIFDVYFTIRYTALEDRSYRDKVLAEMGQDPNGYVETESLRFFSLRNEFPDQWYYFHNPVNGLEFSAYQQPAATEGSQPLLPYTMVLELGESDFVPNEKNRRIANVTLAVQKSDDPQYQDAAIEMKLTFVRGSEPFPEATLNLSAEETSAETEAMNGQRPYGKWVLRVDYPLPAPGSDDIVDVTQDVSWLEDVLLVVEYEAKIHYNR